jgi:hypothetical protein
MAPEIQGPHLDELNGPAQSSKFIRLYAPSPFTLDTTTYGPRNEPRLIQRTREGAITTLNITIHNTQVEHPYDAQSLFRDTKLPQILAYVQQRGERYLTRNETEQISDWVKELQTIIKNKNVRKIWIEWVDAILDTIDDTIDREDEERGKGRDSQCDILADEIYNGERTLKEAQQAFRRNWKGQDQTAEYRIDNIYSGYQREYREKIITPIKMRIKAGDLEGKRFIRHEIEAYEQRHRIWGYDEDVEEIINTYVQVYRNAKTHYKKVIQDMLSLYQKGEFIPTPLIFARHSEGQKYLITALTDYIIQLTNAQYDHVALDHGYQAVLKEKHGYLDNTDKAILHTIQRQARTKPGFKGAPKPPPDTAFVKTMKSHEMFSAATHIRKIEEWATRTSGEHKAQVDKELNGIKRITTEFSKMDFNKHDADEHGERIYNGATEIAGMLSNVASLIGESILIKVPLLGWSIKELKASVINYKLLQTINDPDTITYATNKVARQIYNRAVKVLTGITDIIAFLIGLVTGGTLLIVTAILELCTTTINALNVLYRAGKAIYKTIIGTKGKNRQHHANRIVNQIQGGNEEYSRYILRQGWWEDQASLIRIPLTHHTIGAPLRWKKIHTPIDLQHKIRTDVDFRKNLYERIFKELQSY